ncbi:hypothetical protein [uncultured Pseudacidovorax sp.]|uniref:hypothetical protein n=1 Tax=uncultured Pseudacidovorax sp. TaxID=679313 RepID=UPI0025E4097E|nr:hypothetical protein [uncultured Pseudacidovorax sp.]
MYETLSTIQTKLPGTAVFGGMLRDFALGKIRSFDSDIDLVSHEPAQEILAAIEIFQPTVNRFGGFRFVTGAHRFDIWSLLDTWAFSEHLIECRCFEDILQTTFFNLDAALYNLSSRKLFLGRGYEDAALNRILDINLEANPNPDKMVRRAISMLLNENVGFSPKLCNFIIKHAKSNDVFYLDNNIFEKIQLHLFRTPDKVFRLVQASIFQDDVY